MDEQKNMVRRRRLGVFVSFKGRLLHKHNPSETLDDDLQKLSTNKIMV
jgi:hypothetical protein